MEGEPEPLAGRLARRIAQTRADKGRPVVVGLCGPQGAGKSTLAEEVARSLGAAGLAAFVLSIDDLYLTRAERLDLAARLHPLLAVRGPPGTHDVALGHAVIDALLQGRPVVAPRFDKGRDDRCDPAGLPTTRGRTDVVIFEGWCVGARPQAASDLASPVNTLERAEDPHAVWRTYVNDALAGAYQSLFDRADLYILLLAPDFEAVTGWRQEQERHLLARDPAAQAAMDHEGVARFVQLYERLTRHIAREAPPRADVVVRLDAERRPVETEGL